MLLLTYAPKVFRGEIVQFHMTDSTAWNELRFRLDGLGFLMAGLILHRITDYFVREVLSRHKERVGVFYTYLLVFQGAMAE